MSQIQSNMTHIPTTGLIQSSHEVARIAESTLQGFLYD